jgi:NADPH-dependent curcumin reductase CurA
VGSRVLGLLQWASRSKAFAATLRLLDDDADDLAELTVLGHVGLTAYVGLVTIGRLQGGETVWISAAAGGVGSCAVQFARFLGANVVASATGATRLAMLREELGVAAVIDRRDDLAGQLERLAPNGLDLYLDLVGGSHLRAGIAHVRDRGRVVLVGRSGGDDDVPVVQDSSELIRRRLQLIGMSVTDHLDARTALEALVRTAASTRPFTPVAKVSEGITSIPGSFADLLQGKVLGRAVVHCTPA